MNTTLVWLRRDLRLTDNPALYEALRSGGRVVPVFIDETADALSWSHGSASRWWLHHSLSALASDLASRGSRLIIRRGPSEAALRQIADEMGAQNLFWNRLYEPGHIARDARLKAAYKRAGVGVRSFNGALLHEP
jgi:deoxyribodipyrimidine photo-lyase